MEQPQPNSASESHQHEAQSPAKGKKKLGKGKIALIAFGVFILIGAIGQLAETEDQANDNSEPHNATAEETSTTSSELTPSETTEEAPETTETEVPNNSLAHATTLTKCEGNSPVSLTKVEVTDGAALNAEGAKTITFYF